MAAVVGPPLFLGLIMSSILQTDVLELYNTWGERVAFNEGYKAQSIAVAKQAGRDAFDLGLDKDQGKDLYFASRAQLAAEAQHFLDGDSASDFDAFLSTTPNGKKIVVEPDQIGDITEGEETLGMESCVAGETEDLYREDEWIFDESELMDGPNSYSSYCQSLPDISIKWR